MKLRYSPDGLESHSRLYETGKEFEDYFNSYYKFCDSINNDKSKIQWTYCLQEALEISMVFYSEAAKILSNENKVYDIGSCSGVQRFFFEKNNTEYVGIDTGLPPFNNKYTKGMIKARFPFNVIEEDSCAVSHLCLGYLIPITDKIAKSLAQFKTVIFDYAFITKKEIDVLSKYFDVNQCMKKYEKSVFICKRKKYIKI